MLRKLSVTPELQGTEDSHHPDRVYDSPYSEYLDECRYSKKTRGPRGWLPGHRSFGCSSILSFLVSLFPILKWLPRYDLRGNLTSDLIAGMTVCVMQIPQGMAYAMLANVQPVVGIYMAFFPVIVYSIMGTSKHISVGTFAVVCLMTGKTVSDIHAHHAEEDANGVETFRYTEEQIATVVSFVAGIIQAVMGSMQMGFLCVLLSSDLVSGFTTGAAVHVLTSQVRSLLGLSLKRRNGIFKIPLSYYDIFINISATNVTAVIFSVVSVLILVVYNEGLKSYLSKKLPVPIPIELLVVVGGTLISRYWITTAEYGIPIVSHIPTGFPEPSIPPMELIPEVFLDSLIIAIVAYTIVVSMAKIFAAKHKYEVSANQELVANGASNIVGSFFSCAPISCSLSRSVMQEQVGGKTQLASLFCCGVLVFVLLWIAPFFETLPHCVLSSVIIVALKGMFLQFLDVPKIFRESILNGVVWIATFLGTVVLDIQYGLTIGVISAILVILWRSNKPHIQMCCIHEDSFHDSDDEIILVSPASPKARTIPSVRIVKYTGSLNFATSEIFAKKMQSLIPPVGNGNLDGSSTSVSSSSSKTHLVINNGSHKSSIATISFHPLSESTETIKSSSGDEGDLVISASTTTTSYQIDDDISWIILDLSSVSGLDPAAGKTLLSLTKLYEKKGGASIIFCGCAPPLIEVMERIGLLHNVGVESFQPSVGSAIRYLRRRRAGNNFGLKDIRRRTRDNDEDDYEITGDTANYVRRLSMSSPS